MNQQIISQKDYHQYLLLQSSMRRIYWTTTMLPMFLTEELGFDAFPCLYIFCLTTDNGCEPPWGTLISTVPYLDRPSNVLFSNPCQYHVGRNQHHDILFYSHPKYMELKLINKSYYFIHWFNRLVSKVELGMIDINVICPVFMLFNQYHIKHSFSSTQWSHSAQITRYTIQILFLFPTVSLLSRATSQPFFIYLKTWSRAFALFFCSLWPTQAWNFFQKQHKQL